MMFGLVLRAYAPFAYFGAAFKGDNRGPTSSPNVTSRIKSWVDFDPVAGTVGLAHAKSDASHWIIGTYSEIGMPVSRVVNVRRGVDSLYFELRSAGSNPLVKRAPPIDMAVALTTAVRPGRLDVQARLTGDQFPNVEVLLQDNASNRRTLMSFETTGAAHTGPLRLLHSGGMPMNGLSRSFPIDAEGRFV